MARRNGAVLAGLWLLGGGCSRPEAETVATPAALPVEASVAADAWTEPPSPSDAEPPVVPDAPGQPEVPPQSAVVANAHIVGPTVDRALAMFVQEWTGGGSFWVGPLSGNGGRDVLIFVPPDFVPDRGVRMVTHFHGTYSDHIAKPEPRLAKKEWVGHKRLSQTLEAMTQLEHERDYNVALVYPISAGKRAEPGWVGWFNKAYDRMWMSPDPDAGYTDNFNTLVDESAAVLTKHLGVHPALLERTVIAEGHSAGGIALRNLAEAGTDRVAEYVFLDASFQSWADRCWSAVRDVPDGALVTLVQTEAGIADPHHGRDPWCEWMPKAAKDWPKVQPWCSTAKKPRRDHPPGHQRSCATLEAAAHDWPGVRQWCAELAKDFEGIDRLTLVRTRVSHGDQPRHFTGGLELPARQ